MLNWRKFLIQAAVLVSAVLGVMVACIPSASADAPPSPAPVENVSTDPCFRQDPECYTPEVECDTNVFVPVKEDGTWECPPHGAEPDLTDPRVQEQLAEEVIGRQIDCPDGSVGRITDTHLNSTCEEAPLHDPIPETLTAPVAHTVPQFTSTQYTLGVALLILVAAGTLYMIYRKQPNQ